MCGIAGAISFTSKKQNHITIKKMIDIIHHRGPDSDGIWISNDNKVALAHKRLSIIDLSDDGSQPMHSFDNRFVIVFNGEIYNFNDIKLELQKKGYHFKSKTDTEVLLNAYIEYGETVVNHFIGMWAFVIFDKLNNSVFASRDRVGIKPFYYYFEDGQFIFASEIKSILQHPEVRKEVNYAEIANYLNFGSSTRYNTMFNNIRKLKSGSYIKISKNSIEENEYWNPLKNKLIISEDYDEIKSDLLFHLRNSVKSRMISDVPFGVFLSGGIDSSLNVALMYELMDKPIETFSVGYQELSDLNELEYAEKVSNIFNTNHHKILINENDCYNALDSISFHTDEPNGDPVCMPLYFLSKLTKESGTTVIQVGEGSDEQFVGYKWMMQGYKFVNGYWKYYNYLPSLIKKLIYISLSPIIGSSGQYLAQEYLRRASYNEEFNWSGVPIIPPFQIKELLYDKSLSKEPWKYAQSLYSSIEQIDKNSSYLQKVIYLEQQQRLAEMLLMRVDKMGMAHSLEARVPFLDHRLIEYTSSIPDSTKVKDIKITKSLLKDSIKDLLPLEIIHRKKMGFAAPVHSWFRKEWKGLLDERVLNSSLVRNKILNEEFIKKIYNQNLKGKNNGHQLYSILMLCIWYDYHFAK